jgi:hypothetical protein
MQILRERVRSLLGIELEELTGTRLSGEIPLTNAVVNHIIAARLAEARVPISAARVEALDGNAIGIQLVPSARLIPSVRIEARIERQPEFPDYPVLRLRWSILGAGALARLAAPMIAKFTSLPPGVSLEADLVTIDVRELLVARGFGDIIEFIAGVRIDTRPGVFVIRFEVGIPRG